METALFTVAIVAAVLLCPAMMLWQRRRGNDAACCVPRGGSRPDARGAPGEAAASAEELREQQRQLAAQIAELEASDRARASR